MIPPSWVIRSSESCACCPADLSWPMQAEGNSTCTNNSTTAAGKGLDDSKWNLLGADGLVRRHPAEVQLFTRLSFVLTMFSPQPAIITFGPCRRNQKTFSVRR